MWITAPAPLRARTPKLHRVLRQVAEKREEEVTYVNLCSIWFESFFRFENFWMLLIMDEYFTKDILTTKITKATKGSDIVDYQTSWTSCPSWSNLLLLLGCGFATPLSVVNTPSQ